MIPDEVRQHEVFRVLLQAMSRPGQAFGLPEQTGNDPRRHLSAVVTAICDHESPFHVNIRPTHPFRKKPRDTTEEILYNTEA